LAQLIVDSFSGKFQIIIFNDVSGLLGIDIFNTSNFVITIVNNVVNNVVNNRTTKLTASDTYEHKEKQILIQHEYKHIVQNKYNYDFIVDSN
jgi:hypothetical protein